MANSPISSWVEQMLANISAAGSDDFVGGINTTSGNQNRKTSFATIANWLLKKFKPNEISSLGDGSVIGAINALKSEIKTPDTTLSNSGMAADAKATGDAIAAVMAEIGTPLTAATAADMIDTTKVYVYTGSESGYVNGNWYYYDEVQTAWISGGVYNSQALETDKTLSISDMAADAKKVGDEVTDLKSALNGITIVSENMLNPDDYDIGHYYRASDGAYKALADYACILVPVTEGETYSFTNVSSGHYVFFHNTAITANYVSGASLAGINQITAPTNGTLLALGINITTTPIDEFMFVKGYTIPTGYVDFGEVFVNGNKALLNDALLSDVISRLMASETFFNTEPLPNNDADAIFNNSIYGFWGSTNITHLPNNANQGILITIAGDTLTYQLFISFGATKITTYLRRYYSNSWNEWSEYFGNPLFETYYGTYTTLPWNTANDVPLNSIISFYGVPYANFANLPHPFSILNNGSNSGILITTKGTTRIYLQTFISFYGGVYSRTYTINTSTWSDWKGIVNSSSNYTIDASGNGNTTSFVAGIRYAYANNIRDVYVNPGTYDLISEFQTLYGNNWIDAVASDPVIAEGLPIGHGMVLHCSKKAYVKMIYEGSDTRITTTFSPLNAEIGDYTIDGLNIECQNVRYCVHDELSGHPQYAKHVYINCEMKKTTTEASTWKGYQCIGGGMGHCSVIDVSDSIFESIAPEGSTDDAGAISWHNNANVDAKSYISVKNCVFLGNQGYPRFSYYGLSTAITQVLCSNCKMTRAVSTRGERGATIVNVNVNVWNNEVTQ